MAAIAPGHGIVMHELSKRKNWAQKEAGVVVVFCIVFIVAIGVIGIYVNKCLQRRKDRKAVVN